MKFSFSHRPPTWFWLVASLALVWMLFGVYALYADYTMDDAGRAQMSAEQLQLMDARPAWIFAVYAVAIFSGLFGAIALLLRKAWAVPLFMLSLLAVIVQFTYILFAMGAIRILGAAQAVPFPLVIFTIGAALLWLSLHARRRGWLGR